MADSSLTRRLPAGAQAQAGAGHRGHFAEFVDVQHPPDPATAAAFGITLDPDGTVTATSPDGSKTLHSHGPPPAAAA